MPCYQSIKTPWGKISPKGFSFFPFSFRILIIARWASQGCQGSSLASLSPMNGRLRLPPLTAFAHLANLTIKERKGKRNFTTQQPPARTKIRYLLPVERLLCFYTIQFQLPKSYLKYSSMTWRKVWVGIVKKHCIESTRRRFFTLPHTKVTPLMEKTILMDSKDTIKTLEVKIPPRVFYN